VIVLPQAHARRPGPHRRPRGRQGRQAAARSQGLELELTQDAKDFLIEQGYDEKFGARPLRRAIEQYVEDPLSEDMLRNKYAGKNAGWSRGCSRRATGGC
jgi:hypothetical protein